MARVKTAIQRINEQELRVMILTALRTGYVKHGNQSKRHLWVDKPRYDLHALRVLMIEAASAIDKEKSEKEIRRQEGPPEDD